MLVPLEKPTRNVRFGDTQKGAKARRICKELDRKAGQFRAAVKTTIECYKLWTELDKTGIQITDDGWINNRKFRQYLENMYQFCYGEVENGYDDTGIFEEL